MLTLEQKIAYFQKYLLDNSNECCMKDEIYLYFFELENSSFDFLEKLNFEEEIKNKIDFLVSKMMKHEHEDGLFNIIENYK